MFCPRCGSTQDEELRFCKVCGANLYAVRRAVDTRTSDQTVERTAPWFAEIAVSDAKSRRRQEELDHRRGIAPEVRRYNEIKAGVIVSSVGLGVSTLLYFLMQGIILSGVSTAAAEILSRLWIVGVIPMLVGLSLIVNGVFVTKKLAQIVKGATEPAPGTLEKGTNPLELNSADNTQFVPTSFSVTEDTTKHLNSHNQEN